MVDVGNGKGVVEYSRVKGGGEVGFEDRGHGRDGEVIDIVLEEERVVRVEDGCRERLRYCRLLHEPRTAAREDIWWQRRRC